MTQEEGEICNVYLSRDLTVTMELVKSLVRHSKDGKEPWDGRKPAINADDMELIQCISGVMGNAHGPIVIKALKGHQPDRYIAYMLMITKAREMLLASIRRKDYFAGLFETWSMLAQKVKVAKLCRVFLDLNMLMEADMLARHAPRKRQRDSCYNRIGRYIMDNCLAS